MCFKEQRQQHFQAAAQAGRARSLASKRQMPLWAPMVVACLLDYQAQKGARDEQFVAACATLLVQQAALPKLGAIWRTGWFAEDASVQAALM